MNDETNDNVIEEVDPIEEEVVSPKKSYFSVLIVTVIVLVCSILYIVYRSKQPQKLSQTADTQSEKAILLTEISTHNSKDNCWTTINGDVFDLTKFVSKHKGGDKILAACGVDATDYFTGKHPTIGRVHSELAVKLLSSMKIGTLQK